MGYIQEIENKLGYVFKDKDLLKKALTHKSYAHDLKKDDVDSYNERIEFLGDAILEHMVSIYLYNYTPKMKEGVMSKKRAEIVCEASLSSIMKELDFQKYVKLGKCEINTGGRKKDAILADMAEAILGAIYLDSDFETAERVYMRLLNSKIQEVISHETSDYKTQLQEILQKNGTVKIEYITVKETGKAHDKTFYIDLLYNGKKIGEGNGKSKKEAEQRAAKKAIQEMHI